MSSYNFQLLNDKEFQDLFADVIGELESKHVERFKAGKDQGIDGRFYSPDGGVTILQSKHWGKSGLAQMLRELAKNEFLKVEKLKPERYVFGTSLSLSAKNKQKIRGIFHPYIERDDDVYGYDDICALLSKFRGIERKYYKLWLASFENLRLIHSSAIVMRSGSTIEEINESLTKYVQTSSYVDGSKILEKERVLIVTGEPGVGKTTLAKQLALACVVSGYEFFEASNSIVELEGCWDEDQKQVYYFDDFLGRNYLEIISGKEDSQIAAFIRRIRKNKNKRFILTTRTVILNRAGQLTDRFKIENLDRNEFELVVDDLSIIEKSYMLYNHIWFGDLSRGYVDEIYKDRRYREVVRHPNFNPRLIEFITDSHKASVVQADGYWEYIKQTLENPQDVWANVFERQLSEDARWLVIAVVLNGGTIQEFSLREAFERKLLEVSGFESGKMQRWVDSLRLCIGSVLNRTCRIDAGGEKAEIGLFNPAVGDFILRKYKSTPSVISEVIEFLRTERPLVELSSMRQSGVLSRSSLSKILKRLCERCPPVVDGGNDFGIALAVLVAQEKCSVGDGYWNSWALCIADENFAYYSVRRMARFLSVLVAVESVKLDSRLIVEYWEGLLDDADTYEEYLVLSPLFTLVKEYLKPESEEEFHSRAVALFKDNVDNWVREQGILDDYYATDEGLDDARDALENAIDSWAEELGFSFDSSEAWDIASEVDVDDIVGENGNEDWDSSVSYGSGRSEGRAEDENTIIDDIFERE